MSIWIPANNYYYYSDSLTNFTGGNWTASLWVYQTDNTVSNGWVGIGNSADTLQSIEIWGHSSGTWRAAQRDNGVTTMTASPTPPNNALGSWNHMFCGTNYTDNNRIRSIYNARTFVNAGDVPTNNPTVDQIAIGCWYRASTPTIYGRAQLAHFALWDRALPGDTAAALYGGASPLDIYPENLKLYYPFFNGGDRRLHSMDPAGQGPTLAKGTLAPKQGFSEPVRMLPRDEEYHDDTVKSMAYARRVIPGIYYA